MTPLTPAELSRYAPYHTLPAFTLGYDDYRRRSLRHNLTGVEAQAYDRGAECAMLRE